MFIYTHIETKVLANLNIANCLIDQSIFRNRFSLGFDEQDPLKLFLKFKQNELVNLVALGIKRYLLREQQQLNLEEFFV